MAAQVDRRHRLARAGEQALATSACSPAKREHRAAVVRIGVDVEQPQGAERAREPLDVARSRPSLTFGTASSTV